MLILKESYDLYKTSMTFSMNSLKQIFIKESQNNQYGECQKNSFHKLYYSNLKYVNNENTI